MPAQPVAWLCEWYGDNDAPGWDQYHDATDPMPDEWEGSPPSCITPLYAAPQAVPAPAGLVLVPVEPTQEMQWAGCLGLDHASSRDLDATLDEMAAAYRAMLAAAPKEQPHE